MFDIPLLILFCSDLRSWLNFYKYIFFFPADISIFYRLSEIFKRAGNTGKNIGSTGFGFYFTSFCVDICTRVG